MTSPPATGLSTAKPTVFLDRDGVVNHDNGYIHKPADFVWIEGAKESIKRLNETGHLVIVVTNQAGVARGLYTECDVNALHSWVNLELRRIGACIDAFYHCPHHPDVGSGPYTCQCECRKPAPGMLLQAMREWPIDRNRSFLIGDRESDLAAAAAAGIPGHLFTGGNLAEFLDQILVSTGS